jgi:hypothetical protein
MVARIDCRNTPGGATTNSPPPSAPEVNFADPLALDPEAEAGFAT